MILDNSAAIQGEKFDNFKTAFQACLRKFAQNNPNPTIWSENQAHSPRDSNHIIEFKFSKNLETDVRFIIFTLT